MAFFFHRPTGVHIVDRIYGKPFKQKRQGGMISRKTMEVGCMIAAGFSFYVMCMILPLVGPSGARVPYAERNAATFTSVLLVTLALAAASTYLAMARRKSEGGRWPWFPLSLAAICILSLFILLLGGFAR